MAFSRATLSVAGLAMILGAGAGVSANELLLNDKTDRGFDLYTIETAPADSRAVLESVNQSFGFVPNLMAVMAESPALLTGYAQTQGALSTMGVLTPQENNLVQIAISRENECQYCLNGHSMIGENMLGQDGAEVGNLRKGYRLADAKHEALRAFAVEVYQSKGRVSDESLEAFLAAGYTRRHALDVVAGVGAKVMSNLTNQLAQTPLDEPIKSYRDSH